MADKPPTSTPPTPPSAGAQLGEQVKAIWSRMPKLARLGAMALVAVVLGAIVVITLRGGGEAWKPVAEQMAPEDASELSAVLAGRGIPQRVGAGGRTVEVPEGRLAEARLAAASAGLPRGGVGFELFEGVSLGQSSFAEQVNYRRALQGELARSIAALAPVEGARVHVALGKRSVFKDADEPPSASVALRVRPGARLTPEQVRGVMELVAASVDGLDADKVVVVDQHGEVLSGEQKDGGSDQATLETAIGARVRAILERIVGAGHVAVVVSVEMDRRRVSQQEEIFDKDKVAVRSETRVGNAPAASAGVTGGIAGVQGNLPGAPGATGGGAGGGAGSNTGSSTTNYEVSRVVRQIDEPGDKIARLHLAILVDHKADENGELQPLPQAELDQLAQLARQAAGFDAQRGDALEIRSFAFVPDEATAPPPVKAKAGLPVPLPALAGGGVALVIVAFLLLRKRGKKPAAAATATLALPAPVAELERALAARERELDREAIALPPGPSPERTLEERVLGAVRSDVPRTARVISSWLAAPDPKPSK